MRASESQPELIAARYAAVALLLCVVLGAVLLQAKYRLLSAGEVALYGASLRGAVSLRLPFVLGFAVALTAALLAVERVTESSIGALKFVVLTLLVTLGVGIQQAFSLREVRRDRQAFFAACKRLERAAAPGEQVLFEDARMAKVFAWYGVQGAALADVQGEELVYVGSAESAAARRLAGEGYALTQDTSLPEFRVGDARLYFAARPTKAGTAAVSSKP